MAGSKNNERMKKMLAERCELSVRYTGIFLYKFVQPVALIESVYYNKNILNRTFLVNMEGK